MNDLDVLKLVNAVTQTLKARFQSLSVEEVIQLTTKIIEAYKQ